MNERIEAERMAAAWIARRDSGSWTKADAEALQDWLAQSSGHRVAYYRLNAAWHQAGRIKELQGTSTSAASRLRSDARWSLAASIIVSFGLALLVAISHSPADVYTTDVGGLRVIHTEDGSTITLNTRTALKVSLTRKERRIELESGEAYFEVAKDGQRPFVVSVGDRRVTAVGTAFSVQRKGKEIKAVVTEGQVRVEAGSTGAAASDALTAGSVVRTRAGDIDVTAASAMEVERTLSWRRGVLTFRETPLVKAVAEFNRYSDRQIIILDRSIEAIEIGGVFRTSNPESFVRLLEQGFAIRASVADERILLSAKEPDSAL